MIIDTSGATRVTFVCWIFNRKIAQADPNKTVPVSTKKSLSSHVSPERRAKPTWFSNLALLPARCWGACNWLDQNSGCISAESGDCRADLCHEDRLHRRLHVVVCRGALRSRRRQEAVLPWLNKKIYGWKSLGSNVNGVTAVTVIRALPE